MISSSILFLDIDGVLNSLNYLRYGDETEDPDSLTWDQSQIDPKKISLINHIVAKTKCDIVISSAWRIDYKLADLRGLLKSRGLTGRVVGKTPHLPGSSRGDEIQAWLNSHIKMGIEIITFAILEDEEDMGLLESRTVRTNFADGLTESHAERVIRLLE